MFPQIPADSRFEFIEQSGSVETTGSGRLASALTVPVGPGPFPAMLLLPGLGDASVVDLPQGAHPYRHLTEEVARAGFVTLRVDKPGVGRSEGGMYRKTDFVTEVSGFLTALDSLRSLTYVDSDRLFLFGHSLGGVVAPLLAAVIPLRGIVVFGTSGRPWIEYEVAAAERRGRSHKITSDGRSQALRALLTAVLLAGEHLSSALLRYPGAQRRFGPGESMHGKDLAFFRQLADLDVTSLWWSVDTKVLAIYGCCDIATSYADHRILTSAVEASSGEAELISLPGSDHFMTRALSPEESASAFRRGELLPVDERIAPLVIDRMQRWARDSQALPAACRPGAKVEEILDQFRIHSSDRFQKQMSNPPQVCGECGRPICDKDNFCPQCGVELARCTRCDLPFARDARFCGHCGIPRL